MATEEAVIATARNVRRDMTDQEERPVPTVPSRRAAVLSDERRAECMASGTPQFGRAAVIDLHARAPPGTGIVVGGAWGCRGTATSTRPTPPMAHSTEARPTFGQQRG